MRDSAPETSPDGPGEWRCGRRDCHGTRDQTGRCIRSVDSGRIMRSAENWAQIFPFEPFVGVTKFLEKLLVAAKVLEPAVRRPHPGTYRQETNRNQCYGFRPVYPDP